MKKILMAIAIILGLACVYIGYVYLTHSAGTLPTFMPGYAPNSTIIHIKHAIASLLLAVACFIFAWFQSGKKKPVT